MTVHWAIAILLSAVVLALGLEPAAEAGAYVVSKGSWQIAALAVFLAYLGSAATFGLTRRHHRSDSPAA
ncbi:MAG: hypothetical protein PVG82_00940 [Chromatiales bacterium]|jgi:hypothetical protein